jgi:hypothetical protein
METDFQKYLKYKKKYLELIAGSKKKTPVQNTAKKAEDDRKAAEKAARIAREKAEREKVAREKAAEKAARIAREKAEREKAEREKAARIAKEKAEREKAEREKAEREKAEREKAERAKAEREKTAIQVSKNSPSSPKPVTTPRTPLISTVVNTATTSIKNVAKKVAKDIAESQSIISLNNKAVIPFRYVKDRKTRIKDRNIHLGFLSESDFSLHDTINDDENFYSLNINKDKIYIVNNQKQKTPLTDNSLIEKIKFLIDNTEAFRKLLKNKDNEDNKKAISDFKEKFNSLLIEFNKNKSDDVKANAIAVINGKVIERVFIVDSEELRKYIQSQQQHGKTFPHTYLTL